MSLRHVLLILLGCLTALAGEMVPGDHHQLITLATGVVTGAFGHAMSGRRRARRRRVPAKAKEG